MTKENFIDQAAGKIYFLHYADKSPRSWCHCILHNDEKGSIHPGSHCPSPVMVWQSGAKVEWWRTSHRADKGSHSHVQAVNITHTFQWEHANPSAKFPGVRIWLNSLNEGHAGHKATLTGNMQAGFSADDSAEGVGCQALVDADVFVFVQMADAKVSSHEREVWPWSGMDERLIEFPPVDKNIHSELKKRRMLH